MANTATLPASAFLVLCVGVSFVVAIVKPEGTEIAPLDSTKSNLNSGLALTKPEVASFTMMERMMKSLKQQARGPNDLSDVSPLLNTVMAGLITRSNSGQDGSPTKTGRKAPSIMSMDLSQLTTSSGSAKYKPSEGALTAQSSIADIMAHLSSIPYTSTGSSTSSHVSSATNAGLATSTSGSSSQTVSMSDANGRTPTGGMKFVLMQLSVAADLLKTSSTTLSTASDIIKKLIASASETENGNGHEPAVIYQGSSSDGRGESDKTAREYTSGNNGRTEKANDWPSSGASRRSDSIVDNRHLTPFQSVFGEIVQDERGPIHSPLRESRHGEKDVVMSGKNSLQPNSKDKDMFSHPLDFPHQAEPYPHLHANGKSPDKMHLQPPMNMGPYPGSMMSQFESPVPPQHSMPMGASNQGFHPGPNPQQFGGGPGPSLNRGFMPQRDPRSFMTG